MAMHRRETMEAELLAVDIDDINNYTLACDIN